MSDDDDIAALHEASDYHQEMDALRMERDALAASHALQVKGLNDVLRDNDALRTRIASTESAVAELEEALREARDAFKKMGDAQAKPIGWYRARAMESCDAAALALASLGAPPNAPHF